MELLLDVWREACRHIEITESTETIARLLAPRLGAAAILVRRFDLEHQRLETVTIGVCRSSPVPSHERSICRAPEMRALLAWSASGRLLHRRAPGDAELLRALAPSDWEGDVMAVPLRGEDGPMGALLALSESRTALSDADGRLLVALAEPFSVALANHDRLHELARLREALEADKRALLARLDRHDVMDAIVGREAGLRVVMERVDQVAATDAPVLLLGETGTGKEVVARAIHARSHRAAAPVVRVNCGALPSGLVDSELFGHERGSFTGAIAARKGWFERADGGTLFLDEVAELPLDAQVRLLRIVQDGTFERVGGSKQLTADVRLVAATHRDLPGLVAAGRFREDLWYRIGVFPIRLPPLRERIEDIPTLAAHFAQRAGVRLAGVPLAPSADDVALLLRYGWPGNVRELAAVIERAAILGEGHRLEIRAALGGSVAPIASRETSAHASRQDSSLPHDRGEATTLNDTIRRHIEDALRQSHGRIEGPFGAAVRLAINPHTLRSRMRKLGIDWRSFR